MNGLVGRGGELAVIGAFRSLHTCKLGLAGKVTCRLQPWVARSRLHASSRSASVASDEWRLKALLAELDPGQQGRAG